HPRTDCLSHVEYTGFGEIFGPESSEASRATGVVTSAIYREPPDASSPTLVPGGVVCGPRTEWAPGAGRGARAGHSEGNRPSSTIPSSGRSSNERPLRCGDFSASARNAAAALSRPEAPRPFRMPSAQEQPGAASARCAGTDSQVRCRRPYQLISEPSC